MISRREVIALSVSACGLLTASVSLAQGEVYELSGSPTEQYMGLAVGRVGDIDGDGIPDLAGGGIGLEGPGGLTPLQIWSGATGALILQISQSMTQPDQFTSIGPAGDVNADGVLDILVANSVSVA